MESGGDVLAFPNAPEGVEIRHLRAFVAVAEELNFGRAATRLYLSQPALSRQIRALEQAVGVELLRRSTHRVELTIAGDALLDRARGLLTDLAEAISATQSVGGELTGRMARMWAPIMETASAEPDIQEMRTAYEQMHGQFAVPPEVEVRPVNAGGVSALTLGDEPSLLFLHGGGYVVGSAYGYRALVGALVVAAGRGALVPDFRLAPEHPFPAALEDALSSYHWLLEQREPSEIVLAGDSAGAGLVLSLLLTLRERELPLPAGAMLLCPGIDPTGSRLEVPAGDDAPAKVRRLYGLYLAGRPADDPIVNPLAADLGGLPSLLIQTGTGDMARRESTELAERARAHGVDARLELYPAETHVFQVFWSFLPEAADALQQAGAFTREVTGAAQAHRAAGA